MNFERPVHQDAISEADDLAPDFLDEVPSSKAAITDPAARSNIEEAIGRKKKLRDKIDTYLVKNIAETIRISDDEVRAGDARIGVLATGYEKMSTEKEFVENRIAELERSIGKTEEAELPPESRRNVVVITEEPAAGESIEPSGFFGRLKGKIKSSFSSIRSWFQEGPSDGGPNTATAVGKKEDIHRQPVLGENPFPPINTLEKEVPSAGAREVPVVSAPILNDPYQNERYVRGTSESVGFIEPDAPLSASIEADSEDRAGIEAIEKSRLRSAMGFPDKNADSISFEEWRVRKDEEPRSPSFGVSPDMLYPVEEMSAESVLENIEAIRTAYEAVCAQKILFPQRATLSAQEKVMRVHYADALRSASFVLARESRDLLPGSEKELRMRQFVSVMRDRRQLESEKDPVSAPTEENGQEDRKVA